MATPITMPGDNRGTDEDWRVTPKTKPTKDPSNAVWQANLEFANAKSLEADPAHHVAKRLQQESKD